MKLLLPLLLLAAACHVAGDNYERPQIEARGAWSIAQPAADGGASVELERWWSALESAELDELIAGASEGNLDLAVAQARLRQARAELAGAGAGRYPNVDANAGYSRSRRSREATNGAPFFGERENDLFDAGFDAAWELDLFGGVARQVEASRAGVDAGEEHVRDALVTLIAEVARNYVELRGLERRLAVARESIALQRSTAEIVRSRATAGLATELDLARADAQVAQSEAAVPQLEAAVQARVHALGVLAGVEPRALAERLLAAPASIPVANAALALGQPLDLLARRPDVRRAERELARSSALVGVAQAQRWPRVSLGASFGWLANDAGDLFQSSSAASSFGPLVSLPIFDAGRRRAAVDAAESERDVAALAHRETLLQAWREVEDALAQLAGETARRRSLAGSVASLELAAELAGQRWTSGLVDFLAVIDVQRSLFAVQDALAQSETELTLDFIALAKALGGGWSALPPSP